IVSQMEGIIDNEIYGAEISLNIAIPTLKSQEFLDMVQNAFSGSVVPKADGTLSNKLIDTKR
ncbi:IMPACT family protein, partial [Bifidobacteriaceae bacterium WP021]